MKKLDESLYEGEEGIKLLMGGPLKDWSVADYAIDLICKKIEGSKYLRSVTLDLAVSMLKSNCGYYRYRLLGVIIVVVARDTELMIKALPILVLCLKDKERWVVNQAIYTIDYILTTIGSKDLTLKVLYQLISLLKNKRITSKEGTVKVIQGILDVCIGKLAEWNLTEEIQEKVLSPLIEMLNIEKDWRIHIAIKVAITTIERAI